MSQDLVLYISFVVYQLPLTFNVSIEEKNQCYLFSLQASIHFSRKHFVLVSLQQNNLTHICLKNNKDTKINKYLCVACIQVPSHVVIRVVVVVVVMRLVRVLHSHPPLQPSITAFSYHRNILTPEVRKVSYHSLLGGNLGYGRALLWFSKW